MSTSCLNCGADLPESYKYCPNCSQKKDIHRLSFHDLLHDAIHYFTHADKGIFHLLKALATKTGTVAREYVDGKRKKYFPPLNFYLIVATLMVLSMTTLQKQDSSEVAKEIPELSNIADPARRQQVTRIYERRAEAMRFTSRYSNVLSFIALPLIAFVYRLFYLKARFNYIEHLIAGMYMIGFTNLFYLLIFAPLAKLLAGGQTRLHIGIFFLIQMAYFGIYYYGFINRPGKGALAKAFGVSLLSVVLWAALTSAAIGLYITNGLWGLVH
ncbi:MAG: DUF3667 domain-containing protein [Bacteroidetes bacterium]|nr:DUF3667 domain-containing protein [Bacteroidota bacterium]